MASQKSERVVKNTGFMFLRMILIVGIGLVTSREVLRILGVKDFGTYNLVGTIVVMFSFLQSALNNATSRFITFDLGTGNVGNLSHTFSMSLNSEALLGLIILFLSELVGPWFIGHKMNIDPARVGAAQAVFQFSLLSFIVSLLRTPFNSLIIAHERMNYFAYTSIVEASCKLAIVYLLLIINHDKLITYAFLQLLVTILITLWMIGYCRWNFKESRYKLYWDTKLLKKLTNYSGLSLIVNIADVAVIQSISIFFNLFQGLVANAALGIANQVNSQLNQFLGNFSQSYNPQIIKSYAAKDYHYFMTLIYSAGKLSYLLLFGVAFPIMLNIKYLLKLWLKTPPDQTASFLCLIILYSLIDSFSQPLWEAVHATGNLKVHQLLMSSIKILNIPISYILLKLHFPIITVLIVYVLLNLVCAIVRIWWMGYLIHLNVKNYCKEVIFKIVQVSIISIPIPYIIALLIHNHLASLFLTSIMFLGIYGITVYKLALNQKERELVCCMYQKVKDKFLRRN